MKRRLFIVVTLLLIAAPAVAGSLRCGTCLVCPGDSRIRVLRCCGDPEAIYVLTPGSAAPADRPLAHVYPTRTPVEYWVYNRGSLRFVRHLIFEGERLKRIAETGWGD